MPKQFNSPLDDNMWEELDIGSDEGDLFASIDQPSTDAPSHNPAKPDRGRGREEATFYATHGQPELDDRPMQGNYHYLTLLLPDSDAARLKQLAKVYRMKFRPFMRWVIDTGANLYTDGLRPEPETGSVGTKRTAVLLAPAMVDLLKTWAMKNKMAFQPFMRWLIGEFLETYERERMQPEEPEEFVPDEANLTHWASLSVSKFEGVGRENKKR